MILTSPTCKLALGTFAAPDSGALGNQATGQLHLGAELIPDLSDCTKVMAARITIGATSTTGQVTVDTADGSMTVGTAGTRQVETVAVTAAAGCTAAGNLTVTLTSAVVTGSPLAVTVPLTTTAHTTATLIAAAIAAALNARSAVTDWFTVAATGVYVILTSRFPAANDGTLALAITAGLGVSAATSTDTTAGVAGAMVGEGGTADAFGGSQAMTTARAVMVRNSGPGAVTAVSGSGLTVLPPVLAGKAVLWETATNDLTFSFQGSAVAIMDVLIFGK